MTEFIKTIDSFSDKWLTEYDYVKLLRKAMGDDFPKRYVCGVSLDGSYSTGRDKYKWQLIDTTNANAHEVIATRPAIRQISKAGKVYYSVNRFEQREPTVYNVGHNLATNDDVKVLSTEAFEKMVESSV